MKTLVTYEYWGKKFTSQDRLNTLYLASLIQRSSEPVAADGWPVGNHYTFKTLDGKVIASFYKDNGFGFSTQATGIELSNITQL